MYSANVALYNFLCGGVMVACAVAGLFFFRFWKQTGDRFFNIFAWAFWILGVERIIPVVFTLSDEPRTIVYFIRLVAFSLILVAIALKNSNSQKSQKLS
jgi:Family of unknown function (DUF5985)